MTNIPNANVFLKTRDQSSEQLSHWGRSGKALVSLVYK